MSQQLARGTCTTMRAGLRPLPALRDRGATRAALKRLGRCVGATLGAVLCIGLALVPALPAAAAQLSSVAILELEARKGVTAEEGAVLTQYLEAALRKKGRFERLVSFGEVRKQLTLTHAGGEAAACGDDSCMAQVAAAVGARFLVAGNVTRLQDTLVLDVRVLETATAHPVARSNQFVTRPSPEAILAAMDLVVDELVGQGSWAGAAPADTTTPEKPAVAPPEPRPMWPLAGLGASLVAGSVALAALTGLMVYGTWNGAFLLLPISPAGAWVVRGGLLGCVLLAGLSTLAVLATGVAGAVAGALGVVWRPLSFGVLDKVVLALLGAAGALGLLFAGFILLGGLAILTAGLTLAAGTGAPAVFGAWAALGVPLLAPGLLAGPLLAACALVLAGVLWWMRG